MRLKKAILKSKKYLIRIIKLFNRHKYNQLFVQYLNHLGVNVSEKTGFISDDVWMDEVAPELISIEEGVIVSKGVTLLVHDYSVDYVSSDYSDLQGGLLLKPILIKEKAFIGANATLLPGTIIGENSIVGAGSVVKGNVPDNVIIAGNPARVIKSRNKYYEKLEYSGFEGIQIRGGQ